MKEMVLDLSKGKSVNFYFMELKLICYFIISRSF